jgi:hypothetical protein
LFIIRHQRTRVQTSLQGRWQVLTLHENRFVQAIFVILAGWTLLWGALDLARGPFRVEGTIERTFIDRFNGYPLPRFAIGMRTADGRHVTIHSLYGDCLAERRGWGSGRSCTKAEFPLGARIEIEGETIRRRDLCRNATTRYRCRPTVLDQIASIRVNGNEATSGWFGPFKVPSLYLLWAIAIVWLASRDWQIRTVTWYGLVGCVLAVQACLLVL